MMLRLRLLVVALVLGTLVTLPTTTAASGCGQSDNAMTVGSTVYVEPGVIIWAETNGVDGLQKTGRTCTDGTTIPPDTYVGERPDVKPCIGNLCVI